MAFSVYYSMENVTEVEHEMEFDDSGDIFLVVDNSDLALRSKDAVPTGNIEVEIEITVYYDYNID